MRNSTRSEAIKKKRPLERASDRSRELQNDPAYAAIYREAANDELGAALRALRKAKGMSQREVAESMGVTRSRISQIESTEGTALALEVLGRYARALRFKLELSFHDEQGSVAASLFIPAGIAKDVPAPAPDS